MQKKENMIQIGEIYREHGIKGEVKVYIYSNSSENFREGMKVILQKPGQDQIETKIKQVKPYKKWFLTRFDIFNNPEQVLAWRKAALFINKEDLASADEDEHYLYELIGFKVIDQNGELVGVLKGMQREGDSALYVVHNKNGEEILIPAVDEWVKKIDKELETIVIKRREGLF